MAYPCSMLYRFGPFALDMVKRELRAHGETRHVEPQVFALLALLIEHRDRLVTKDEIIDAIWQGRIVSESALASRIKSARAAIDDDGKAQRLIRTLHGQGFRFVGELSPAATVSAPAPGPGDGGQAPPRVAARPSIAVLPFRVVGGAEASAAVADALPQDLITALSRLHWLFVIARASSFQFRDSESPIGRIRGALNVRYGLFGTVERAGAQLIVTVELCDTASEGVIWSDRFASPADAVHEIRETIVRAVINALEIQIPANEVLRARLIAPNNLDAWSAFHLGLHHMYRFTKTDNAIATGHFERAIACEPTFARAYAGLSFTQFQNAFLGYADDVETAADLARRHAESCLERDPLEPFGNLTMGRALWLREDLEGSLAWLDRAGALNPNYAQAKYARGWTLSLIGNAPEGLASVDEALALSPLDPLRYGMLGVRAFAHLATGEIAAAAESAERAASSPGAHALIAMIAAAAHGLNGNDARARLWADSARIRWPDLGRADFFHAFPFRDPATRRRLAKALAKYGF